MKDKLNVGILYLGLHNQLVKKFGANTEISRREFNIKIAKHGQIPHNLREMVMNEMIKKGLLERINRDIIRILPLEIDIEKDCRELYEMAGLFKE
jgi:hypothetical protein